MALDVKPLNCPNCGAPLEVKNVQRAKTLTCSNCGSIIDLTDPSYGILGQSALGSAPPRTPLQLGLYGTLEGERYQIVGRVRYREDLWFWDEWLLLNEAGRFRWLTEGERGFTLYDPFTPANPVDPNTLREGMPIDPEGNGTGGTVGEAGIGRIDYQEGELTWRASVGDAVHYLDANFAGGKYAIEWTPGEVEFFRGRDLTNREVRAAFGLPVPTAATRGFFGRGARVALIATIILLVVICLLCVVFGALAAATDDGSDDPANGGGGGGAPIIIPGGSSGGSSGSSGVRPGSTGGSRSGGSGSSSSGGSSGGK